MESNLQPGLRRTGKKCEWVTSVGGLCTNELTPKELDWCTSHVGEFEGMLLCFSHQKQYLDKKQEAFGSMKDGTESEDINF